MPAKNDIIQRILNGTTETRRARADVFAPANIALCKYWGKRDIGLNLPVTDSLSISLGDLGSRCQLAFAEGTDSVSLNGADLPPDHPFARRLFGFLDAFRRDGGPRYRVETVNTVPTAAGFASSASGFASVVMALNELHGWNLGGRELSILARLGSGSACRSLWQGFVHWHAGTDPEGMDSYAEPLPDNWPDLRIGLLVLESGSKPVGSTEAMIRTVQTSPLYGVWPAKAAVDLAAIRQAIAARDFHALGAAAESNALAMHATMMAARPPVLYWTSASLEGMRRVWTARLEGLPVYLTMDAGPNLKLVFLEKDRAGIESSFPELIIARQGRVA